MQFLLDQVLTHTAATLGGVAAVIATSAMAVRRTTEMVVAISHLKKKPDPDLLTQN